MKLAWTRLALLDLHSAYAYVAEEKPSAAGRMIRRIQKTARAIGRHPELGRLGRVEGTRESAVPGTPFIVAYRVRAKRVEILAVLHAARLWPDQL